MSAESDGGTPPVSPPPPGSPSVAWSAQPPAFDEAGEAGAAGEPPAPVTEEPGARSMTRASWGYAVRRTLREFADDQCTDLAASLTYRSVLAIFPAALALLSLLGLVGQGQATVDAVRRIVEKVGGTSIADTVEPLLTSVSRSGGAGLTFAFGIVLALWSASGYVAAFGRAMNRVYEVEEGRPTWKLRPLMLLVTLVTVVLAGVAALILVLSGGIAEAVGEAIGLGATTVAVWGIVKWPVLLAVVVVIVAVLYYVTPNVRPPTFRWMSLGAAVAILIWVAGSAGFGYFVANFGSYNKTYGSLAGAVVFLLWLWLTNLALLFGAEVDAEIERVRELQAGIKAEEVLQLPPWGTRSLEKRRVRTLEVLDRGRTLRESRGEYSTPPKGE